MAILDLIIPRGSRSSTRTYKSGATSEKMIPFRPFVKLLLSLFTVDAYYIDNMRNKQ